MQDLHSGQERSNQSRQEGQDVTHQCEHTIISNNVTRLVDEGVPDSVQILITCDVKL